LGAWNDGGNRAISGVDSVTETKKPLKKRIEHEIVEYLLIALYLFIVLSLFVVYKSIILRENNIDFVRHGIALINALALGKVILIAQDLHFADSLRNSPLIYPTLLKSVAFTILLTLCKIAEDSLIGRFHGKSFHESTSDLGGGSLGGILTISCMMFVVLVPFFAFIELREEYGADRLLGVFFRPRNLRARATNT
jgi:hypothetical protein